MTEKTWTTLRVVVEVRVPPTPRIAVADLKYQVERALERHWSATIPLPREREGCVRVKPRVLAYGRVAHVSQAKTVSVFERLVLHALGTIMWAVLNRHVTKDHRSWRDEAKTYLDE